MRWVYILRCENDYFYIGETSRLYRIFWEHQEGCGGFIFNNLKINRRFKCSKV